MERNSIRINLVEKSTDSMGIKILNNSVMFFVPKMFRVSEDEKLLKKDLLRFVCSLSISKNMEYGEVNSNYNGVGSAWPVISFLWIIHDYLENGVYYNREKVYSASLNGKIDWKRTLKKVPFISNGNIIYNNPIISKMASTESVLSQIYKKCLKVSVDCLGWAFNYNFPIEINQTKTISEMIYIIKKEYSSTFDDVKKLRFKHMLNILEGINDVQDVKSEYTYMINNYYYVYEKMIDKMFCGLVGKEKKKYNPNASWNLIGKEKKESSNLRPDTIYIKDKKKVFVLDAKLYQYGATGKIDDLPSTSSIQKQVTYGDHIFKNILSSSGAVYNVFILPYNKELEFFENNYDMERYLDGNLTYIGYAEPEWRDFQFEKYNKIHTFMIDYNYLLSNYDKKTNDFIDAICQRIDDKV